MFKKTTFTAPSLGLIVGLFSLTSELYALEDLNVGAGMSYQFLDLNNWDANGLEFSAESRAQLSKLGETAILGGLQGSYFSLKAEDSDSNNTWEYSGFNFGFMSGLGVNLSPQLVLMPLFAFDFNLSGDAKFKGSLGNRSLKIDRMERISHAWKLNYKLNPKTAITGGVKWEQGKMIFKERLDDRIFKGFALTGSVFFAI